MTNKKISALTSATTPLAGTETVPIVQSGATVKTTVADITSGGGYPGSFTTLSATGVTTVQAGTALLPAITTSGDTNTGIWFPAADTIAFTEGGVESFRIDSSGNVGIGRTSPVGRLDVFAASGGGAGTVVPVSITVGDTSSGNAWPGDGTLSTVFNYFSGDGTNNGVRFRHGVGETNASGSASIWKIQYRAAGGAINSYTGFSDSLAVDINGNVIVNGIGGLGYGTGSGGTVTQVTSRTTSVTLNKTNGAITLFTAAGSVTATTFTVTNSTVAATDVVNVCQKSGTNLYNTIVTAVAAGSFNITFYTTGGVASDTPVFNFAVTKAVTA